MPRDLEDGPMHCLTPRFAAIAEDTSKMLESPKLAEIIYALGYDSKAAIEMLQGVSKDDLGEGSQHFKAKLAMSIQPLTGNLNVQLVSLIRAYPREMRKLILWAADPEHKPNSLKTINFFAVNGLLNPRATRPHDNVFVALGMDIPEALHRRLTPEHKALGELQASALRDRALIAELR